MAYAGIILVLLLITAAGALLLYLAFLLGFKVSRDDIYFMRDHELNGYYLRLLLEDYRPGDFRRLHRDGGRDLRHQVFIGIKNDLRELAEHYPGRTTRAWRAAYSWLTRWRLARRSSRLALASLKLEVSYCAWVRRSCCANS